MGLNAVNSEGKRPTGLEATGSHYGAPTELRIRKDLLKGCSNIDDRVKEIVLKKYPNINWNEWEINSNNDSDFVQINKVKTLTDSSPSVYGKDQVQLPLSKKLFEKTTFDVVSHHNQDLDVWNKAKTEGKLKPGGILIHFDTHSDLQANESPNESIADFISTAIADGTFSEVYWVLPDWTKEGDAFNAFWNNKEGSVDFLDSETKHTFYVKGDKVYFQEPADLKENPSSYKIVKFNKVTINDLPTFADKDNVCADIDCDYFSNSGFDTVSGGNVVNFNLSSKELSVNLNSFIEKFKEKNLEPSVLTLCRSPKYTPDEDIPVIESFFKSMFGKLNKDEYIPDSKNAYKHGNDIYDDTAVLTKLFNWIQNDPSKRRITVLAGGREGFIEQSPTEESLLGDLHVRGFSDISRTYHTYKDKPTEANRAELMRAIDNAIKSLEGKKYSFNQNGQSRIDRYA